MKKTGLIVGSIEVILGLISLLATSIIKEVIPKIASIFFMFNTGNFSEKDYAPDFGFANVIAVCLCLIGLLTCVYFVFIKKEQGTV